jgi:hypothetical protein
MHAASKISWPVSSFMPWVANACVVCAEAGCVIPSKAISKEIENKPISRTAGDYNKWRIVKRNCFSKYLIEKDNHSQLRGRRTGGFSGTDGQCASRWS